MGSKKYQLDLTTGPIFKKILLFSVPLMCTSLLQLAFHFADMAVVGKFASANALAGVGCASPISALIINVFAALSIGTSVLAARYFGAKDHHNLRKCVHTTIALALYGGIALLIVGQITAEPLLKAVDTPQEVMSEALAYLRILFLSIPAILLYNSGWAILRAIGDTRRPLYFLTFAGIINILLNLFCVLVLGMGAAGVAVATLAAHCVSAFLILGTLTKSRESYQLIWRFIHFNGSQCKEILRIGIPAAIHSSTYAISNVMIQSSLNSLGAMAVAGALAAGTIEGIASTGAATAHHATLTVVAQNYGANQFRRIRTGFFYCLGVSIVLVGIIGWTLFGFGTQLLWFFTNEPQVVAFGLVRMKILYTTVFLCCLQECAFGALRGLGYSMTATAVPIVAVCGLRLLWVFLVFPQNPTFANLMVSYPITWGVAGIAGMILLHWIWNHRILPEAQKKYHTL